MTVSLPDWGIMSVIVAAAVLLIMLVFAVRFVSWSKMDSDSEDDSDSDSGSDTDSDGGGATGSNHTQREIVTARSVALNLRVMRGPDWRKGDQDGGEGNLGTVLGFKFAGGATQGPENMARLLNRIPPLSAVVVWDTASGAGGRKLFYSIGCNGEHHLSIAPRDRANGGGAGANGDRDDAEASAKFFWRSAVEGERVAGGAAYAEPPPDATAQTGAALPRELTGEEQERWRHFGADNAWGMGMGGGWSGVPDKLGGGAGSLKKRRRAAAGSEKGKGKGRGGDGEAGGASSGRKTSKFQMHSPAWHGGAQPQQQPPPQPQPQPQPRQQQRGLSVVHRSGGTMMI